MMCHRPGCLRVSLLALVSTVASLSGAPQSPSPQPPPAQTQQPNPQQPAPQPPNPFETVPTAPNVPQVKPGTTAPQSSGGLQPALPREDVIEAIQFRGARRVRQDTLQSLIFTKKGDRYDENSLHRDFIALWNTGRFDDIRIEREPEKTAGSSRLSWWSGPWFAPSTTTAISPCRNPTFWIASRSARSDW